MAGHGKQRDQFENENNAKLGSLHEQVSMLKELTLDINNNVDEQNSFLDGMVSRGVMRPAADTPRHLCRATLLIKLVAC
jgi:hypothetical protein